MKNRLRFAAKMAGGHLFISALVAACTAAVVFKVWYPYPYDLLLGSLGIYWLVIAVDVVCGPLLTLVLADPKKSKRSTVQDLTLVACIQTAALLYGLYTVAVVRPVAVMFENDRFVVVSPVDIKPEHLAQAAPEMTDFSWTGVRRLALRKPQSIEESNALLDLGLAGQDPSVLPAWWQEDSDTVRQEVREKMRPLSVLQRNYPDNAALAQAVKDSGLPENEISFLPFTSPTNKDWIVLLDRQTEFVGFAELDGFVD